MSDVQRYLNTLIAGIESLWRDVEPLGTGARSATEEDAQQAEMMAEFCARTEQLASNGWKREMAAHGLLWQIRALIYRRYLAINERDEARQENAQEIERRFNRADQTIQRLKGVLAVLGFMPGVQHTDQALVEASEVLDAIRSLAIEPEADEGPGHKLRHEENLRRIRAACRSEAPRGVLFGPRGSQPIYLSPLVSDLLALYIENARRTLDPRAQEEQIAEALGLLRPGESFAEARERLST